MKLRDAAAAALIVLISLAVSSYGRSRIIAPDSTGPGQVHLLTGDEPSYLLMAHSIVADGDLNLYNNALARDGRWFGMERAGPHAARRDNRLRLIYSIHTPGLPMLIAPAYALAIRMGVSPRAAVCVFMNILAALLAVNAWLFCRGLSRLAGCASPRPALLSTAAVMLTPPVVFYSNLVYPELPAALLLLYAFRQALAYLTCPTGQTCRTPITEAPAPPRPHALTASLAVAFLPWLSFRFFLPAFILAALLARAVRAERPASRWRAVLPALPLLASLALFFSYQHRAFGSFSPDAGYIHQHYASWRLSGLRMLDGILGIILDTGHGILTWSPVYILALAGMLLLLRERPPLALWMGALLLAVYLPAATFVFWWGGFAPAPRYMVVPAPLLGGALSYALARKPPRVFVAIFFPLLCAGLLVGYLGLKHPELLYRHSHLVTHYRLRPIVWCFPAFIRKNPWTWPLAAFWSAAILSVNGLCLLRWKRPPETAAMSLGSPPDRLFPI